ncbi:MAG: glutamate--tRNA ligase [Planctomycetes bacterium]|nr:glutamate--tRNA ligase [Planctomycetota bacterium]
MAPQTVRVRFAPSPTGYLHIGGARTVLFNWLLARQAGGVFVLRIEDTDRARHVEGSVEKILEDLRWLGMDWDEGPEVGGSFGPYFQSERLDRYREQVERLLESGDAYYALESSEELAAMRQRAKREKGALRYRRPDPLPTIAQGRAARDEGRSVAVRFKMPGRDIVVEDEILGEVRISADELEDFIIQKADGWPTYHFACVVDDEQMKITHVLRGQEHLMNTPKHIALQEALGFATPVYAHLPIIFNMDGTKMSKRDKEKAIAKGQPPPEIDVHDFRRGGYLPEALLNFIALLGWSPGGDREHLTLDETIELFSLKRVGATNARFDRDKLLSFNTEWAARLDPERLADAFENFADAGSSVLRHADDATLRRLLRICSGFRTFRDVEAKSAFLFVDDDALEYQAKAVRKVLAKGDGAGFAMLESLLPELESLSEWDESSLEAFFERICETRGAKLGAVAQPVRVAVTGTTISPPIYDTLALLGRDRTLKRIRRALGLRVEQS